jgi:hypothetical protein
LGGLGGAIAWAIAISVEPKVNAKSNEATGSSLSIVTLPNERALYRRLFSWFSDNFVSGYQYSSPCSRQKSGGDLL